jgi:hypothetical protein
MATKKPNFGTGANYSTLSSELICTSCKHSQIVESSNGHSLILCHYKPGHYGAPVIHIDMLVTKCNRHDKEEVGRIWDTAIKIDAQDNSLWMEEGRWVKGIGIVHPRIDTFHSRKWIVKQFPNKVLDLDTGWWEGEEKPAILNTPDDDD